MAEETSFLLQTVTRKPICECKQWQRKPVYKGKWKRAKKNRFLNENDGKEIGLFIIILLIFDIGCYKFISVDAEAFYDFIWIRWFSITSTSKMR